MPHPVHEILRRFLGSEQFALDTNAREIWPWERDGEPSREPDEWCDDEEPTQFDDVYPWLEPQS